MRSSYTDVRRSFILLEYDQTQGALLALLRLDPVERAGTRDALRRLGFHPNASPERWSISWRRYVSPSELRTVCKSVHDALGDDTVLDLGASFAHIGKPLCASELPTFWPAQFVLHVGGTRRCVIFDARVEEHTLALAFQAERDAYFANDFVPATE